MATTLLRIRIAEDFTDDNGLKLGLVSGQIGLLLAGVIAEQSPVTACNAVHCRAMPSLKFSHTISCAVPSA